jgi:Derlin-2/3
MLEENSFAGRRGDYVWLLLVSMSLLILLSPLSATPFLASPLSFTLVYLWSRYNQSMRLSLFGIFTVTAPHLPYALVLFSWILSSGSPGSRGWGLNVVMGDLLGIFVGHWWYFWTEIWKRERGSGGRNWLETPKALVVLLDGRERAEERERERERQERRREGYLPVGDVEERPRDQQRQPEVIQAL